MNLVSYEDRDTRKLVTNKCCSKSTTGLWKALCSRPTTRKRGVTGAGDIFVDMLIIAEELHGRVLNDMHGMVMLFSVAGYNTY